jgi:hypothetical protein
MALRPSELTQQIDAAFAAEWARTKDIPLPAAGAEDRRLLFAAVARGLLEYLKEHQGDAFDSITLRDVGDPKTWTVTDTELNIVSG